jgi:hypothetical protein
LRKCKYALAQDSQTKMSHIGAVEFNTRQRPDLFHARHRTPPVHSARQGFENAGVWGHEVENAELLYYY